MENPRGIRTSEFWLALVAQLIGYFMASGILADTHIALRIAGFAGAVLATMGYTFMRGKVKTEEAKLKMPEWVKEEPADKPE